MQLFVHVSQSFSTLSFMNHDFFFYANEILIIFKSMYLYVGTRTYDFKAQMKWNFVFCF